MTKMREEWGCPDWREKDRYPASPDLLRDWEWRWQFLRRNEKYRELFFSLEKMPSLDESAEEGDFVRGFGTLEDTRQIVRCFYNMSLLRNPLIDKLDVTPFRSHVGGDPLKFPSSEYFEELWPEDPQKRFEALLYFMTSTGVIQSERPPSGGTMIELQMWYFQFNPLRPFKAQAEKAKKTFESRSTSQLRESRKGGTDRQFWPRYLRVIDAEDQGATPTDIFLTILGDELCPDEFDSRIDDIKNPSQAGKNMIKSAREVMRKVSLFL